MGVSLMDENLLYESMAEKVRLSIYKEISQEELQIILLLQVWKIQIHLPMDYADQAA